MGIVSAVGIATMGRGDRPADHERGPSQSGAIREAMELAVLSSVQHGITDNAEVKARVMAAYERARRSG